MKVYIVTRCWFGDYPDIQVELATHNRSVAACYWHDQVVLSYDPGDLPESKREQLKVLRDEFIAGPHDDALGWTSYWDQEDEAMETHRLHVREISP